MRVGGKRWAGSGDIPSWAEAQRQTGVFGLLAGGSGLAAWGRPGPVQGGDVAGRPRETFINNGAAKWPQVLLTQSCVMRRKTQVRREGRTLR